MVNFVLCIFFITAHISHTHTNEWQDLLPSFGYRGSTAVHMGVLISLRFCFWWTCQLPLSDCDILCIYMYWNATLFSMMYNYYMWFRNKNTKVPVFNFLNIYPEVRLIMYNNMVILFLTFQGTAILFFLAALFYIPNETAQDSRFSTSSLIITLYYCYLIVTILTGVLWYHIVVFIAFFWGFERLNIFLYAFWLFAYLLQRIVYSIPLCI